LNVDQLNIADVEFIVEAVDRFYQMTPKQVIDHIRKYRRDAFATLSLSAGGLLFCGHDAYDRFVNIADRSLKPGSDEEKAFGRNDYISSLRKAFVELFIECRAPVSTRNVAKFLSRGKKLAAANLVRVTRHVPCVVFYDKKPSVFSVGPVVFRTRQAFFGTFTEALAKFLNAERDAFLRGLEKRRPDLSQDAVAAEAESFAGTLDRKLREYYGEYAWVASVEIAESHESVSQRRAEQIIDAALDVLRLFVPPFSERLRRATSPRAPYETRELSSNAQGELFMYMRQGGRGAPAGDGWYDEIQTQAPELWRLFGDAVDPLRSDMKTDELNQRLLDALNWFGQAVVEPSTAAAIVKYTAALERLTMTGHVASGIEETVVRRVSLLNFGRMDKAPPDVKLDVARLYQTRSDLMHGSQSPYDPKLRSVLLIASDVTRWSILQAAQVFDSLRVDGKANRRALSKFYDDGGVDVRTRS
jgi:hypothetical protein